MYGKIFLDDVGILAKNNQNRRTNIMKKVLVFAGVCIFVATAVSSIFAHNDVTFTGTAVSYGSGFNTRTRTSAFTMKITGVTPDLVAARYLSILQSGGQDDLLKAMKDQDLGFFALTGRLGDTLTGVRVTDLEGKRLIRAVFERRVNIAELRYGSRSTDYPFGYVELIVDARTGKGDGTYIPAAQIKFKKDKRTWADNVEIEGFATFPAKLIGVQMRGARVP
jgi:hypothetical protein